MFSSELVKPSMRVSVTPNVGRSSGYGAGRYSQVTISFSWEAPAVAGWLRES